MPNSVVPLIKVERNRQHRVVELIGPAGAGKTTVCQALLASNNQFIGNISLSRARSAPLFFAAIVPRLLPLGCDYLRGRPTRAEQIRKMAHAHVLAGVLHAQDELVTWILDQGPIYLLTKVCALGPIESLEEWRNECLDRWASLIDVIVWLDAPDSLLLERINSREKQHKLRGSSDRSAKDVFEGSRALFRRTISELATRGTQTTLHFDTSRTTPDEIVASVRGAMP